MRRHLDAYMTPKWQTEALLKRIPIHGKIFEPCAGDLAIAHVLTGRGDRCITNDINPECATDYHGDATQYHTWMDICGAEGDPDWTVSNLPFLSAFPIVKLALHFSGIGVALLLRHTFLEPTLERGEWLENNPPDAMIVLPRWSYTGNGKSDNVTTSWLIWMHDRDMAGDYGGIYIHKDKPRKTKKDILIEAINGSNTA